MEDKKKLIFIYAADSGVFNTVTDIAHKIFSPKTYECQLCKISHGWFSMHEDWRKGIENLGVEPEYYHRDRLPAALQEFCSSINLPCVLLQDENRQYKVLMDREEISRCDGIDTLLDELAEKLSFGKEHAQ